MARRLVTALALVTMLTAGCSVQPDDEMVVPSVTETAAPKPPTGLPKLPVGKAGLAPGTQVSVSGTVVSAAGRIFDITPLHIDAHVVTPGGIYFLNDGELWFTDLARVIPTPFHRVRGLSLSKDRGTIAFVDLEHGAPGEDGARLEVMVRYDVRSGAPIEAKYVTTAS